MPGLVTANTPGDDLDDLYSYDVNDADEVFRDFEANLEVAPNPASNAASKINPEATDLGLDTEIKVAKSRKPVAKLDEARLLSQAGIPKLRRITKDRLKFKGKGHEYSDSSRLLNLYQLWLDDLYPRAKFPDGLAMIEKLGHSRRMQTMRREWINEGKLNESYKEKDIDASPSSKDLQQKQPRTSGTDEPKTLRGRNNMIDPDTGEDQSFTAEPATVLSSKKSNRVDQGLFLSDNEPEEDELDDLLAENAGRVDFPELSTLSETKGGPPDGHPITAHDDDLDMDMNCI